MAVIGAAMNGSSPLSQEQSSVSPAHRFALANQLLKKPSADNFRELHSMVCTIYFLFEIYSPSLFMLVLDL
jgi:hypothetical protein